MTLTPGWSGVADVGGRYTAEVGSFHGKRGIKVSFDSMVIENSDGNSSYQINSQSVSEMVAQTSGVTAEVNADGPVMNIIPREGSNKFSVIGNSLYTNSNLESSNLNDELRDRGFTNVNKTYQMWDHGATISGPIKQDRVWFLAAPRTWGFSRQIAGAYWNKTQDVFLTPPGAERKVVKWTPWTDRELNEDSGRYEWYNSGLARGTWQIVAAQQVQRVVRLSARVQLLRRDAGERAGSDQRLQVPAQSAGADDLELAADQPAAARGGRRLLDLAVERLLASRRDP